MTEVNRSVSSFFRETDSVVGSHSHDASEISGLPNFESSSKIPNHNDTKEIAGGYPYMHLNEFESHHLGILIDTTGYTFDILVSNDVPDTIDGVAYSDLADAVAWCQTDALAGISRVRTNYVIHISSGEYNINQSLIMNKAPVSFVGAGKGLTILKFDRTDEANNYWIRTSASATPEEAPRICFAYCDYTDQTIYGLADEYSWEGSFSIAGLTMQLEYSADYVSSSALLPVYITSDNSHTKFITMRDVEVRTFGNPQRLESSSYDTYCFYYYPNTPSTLTNEKPIISFLSCDFLGNNKMTGLVNLAIGANALNGTGTLFTTELSVGQYIDINNRTYQIATIVDDDTATITGVADVNHVNRYAVAINPLSNAIYINDSLLSKKADVSITNCTFIWVGDAVFSLEDCDTTLQNVYIENCTHHYPGHVRGLFSSAMLHSYSGHLSIVNARIIVRGHIEKVLTSDWRMVIGCDNTAAYLSQLHTEERDSTTFTYYSFFETDEKILASDCTLGTETSFAESFCVKLTNANCGGSTFNNCRFYGGPSVFSSLSAIIAALDVKVSNCYFHRDVKFISPAEEFKAVNSEFNGDVQMTGSKDLFTNCIFNSAITIGGNYHRFVSSQFEDTLVVSGDNMVFCASEFLADLDILGDDNRFDTLCLYTAVTNIGLRNVIEVPFSESVITNANLYMTDFDGRTDILFSTGAVDRICELPPLAELYHRQIRITKIDAGVGKVTVQRNGSDTFIDGSTYIELLDRGDTLVVGASSYGWKVY